MMVPREEWNAHAEKKYEKGFLKSKDDFVLWCGNQKAMVPVKDWNSHVETEVKKLSSNGCCKLLCRICCTMVSKGNLNDHVTSKHKRTFLSDVNLPELDLWCAIRGKIVLMADWNKHTVSEHKESLERVGDLWCRVCNRAVPSKDWNAHGEEVSMTKEIQAKHNMKFADGFWNLCCSKCNISGFGKKVE